MEKENEREKQVEREEENIQEIKWDNPGYGL